MNTREEHLAFWKTLSDALAGGDDLLRALEKAAEGVQGTPLEGPARGICRAIEGGSSLADALREFPDDIPGEVVAAVAAAELEGALERKLSEIADALAREDLASLVADMHADVSEPAIGEGDEVEQEQSPIIELVSQIITEAVRSRASDIHIEPAENKLRIRYRIDGVLHEVDSPPKRLQRAVTTRIKIMASFDVAERRLPQDGRITMEVLGRKIDLRISSVPDVWGERITMRILDRSGSLAPLDKLGFSGELLEGVRKVCHLPYGMVICNGPTGSGKTTVLYALINEMNRPDVNIMSIEDPVEYSLSGVSQIQIRSNIGLTFPRVLRSVLRQDPDVIMVGEMRDLETVEVSVQAAMTGHLVLSTLHADTSPGGIRRLLDIGIEPYLVNASLAGMMSQRLVRVLCTECRRETKPDPSKLPAEAMDYVAGLSQATFYAPNGCDACQGTGYRGRSGIYELLIPDDGVRKAVSASASLGALREAAMAAGMKPLLLNGIDAAARGVTSIEEVLRVAPRGPNI